MFGKAKLVETGITSVKEIITNGQEAKEHQREIVAQSQDKARDFTSNLSINAKDWLARNIVHLIATAIVASFLFATLSPMFGFTALELVSFNSLKDLCWMVLGVYFGNTMQGIAGKVGKTSRADMRHQRKMEKLKRKQ